MTESLIDKIVQDYFIEYLKEDLENYKPPESETEVQISDSDQTTTKPRGGLLGADEKTGVERLIECMHCCMWSNMKKKKLD